MPWIRASGFFGLLAIAFFAAACDSGDDDSPWEGSLADRAEAASEYQQEILEDGTVTDAEYERAMLAQVQCMEDEGIEVTVRTEENGQIGLGWGGVPTTGKLDEMGEVARDCAEQYSDVVGTAWNYLNLARGDDDLPSAAVECFADLDFELATFADMWAEMEEVFQQEPEDVQAWLACEELAPR